MGDVRLVKHMLWGALVWLCLPFSLEAQVFRLVRNANELVVGGKYVFTSPDMDNAVFVADNLETNELEYDYRPVESVSLNDDGLLEVNDKDIAVFELVDIGNNKVGLYDVANDRWLAYPEKKKSSNWASLYTYPEERIKDGLHRDFIVDSSSDITWLWTAEKIQVTSTRNVLMGITFRNYGDKGFRLCDVTNEPPLRLYRQVETPVLDSLSGDWTFSGDWRVSELSGLDYSKAKRIDFANIFLPEAWKDMQPERMPSPYVWTYVRKGEAELLPAGWPNVVECASESDQAGVAMTEMIARDGYGLPPKYTFRTATGKGILWYRQFPSDGGWSTIWLPFIPQEVRSETSEDEIDYELLQYSGIVDDGVLFCELPEGGQWTPCKPVLWRSVENVEHVCFYADDVTVYAVTDDADPKTNGYYPVYHKISLTDDEQKIYFLKSDGITFVRARSGSWIEPYRAYLYLPTLDNQRLVRLIVNTTTDGVSNPTNCENIRTACYDLSGRICGRWDDGLQINHMSSHGLYIWNGKKIFKP